MWTYNGTDTLMHYGVLGMKWGKRKASKLYSKVGRQRGAGDYYTDQGKKAASKYNSRASVLNAKAKEYESKGKLAKAEKARQSAKKLTSKGADARRQWDEQASKYYDKASRIEEKVTKYATKKRVDLGKARIDSILKKSTLKGYNETKSREDYRKMAEFEYVVNEALKGYRGED